MINLGGSIKIFIFPIGYVFWLDWKKKYFASLAWCFLGLLT
jgi:uncharacterized membrane protein YhfC